MLPIPYMRELRHEQPDWPLYSLFFLFLASSIFGVALISLLNVYFLVLALIVWATKKRPLPKSLGVLLTSFAVIIALGMTFGYNNDLYPYLKDAWYFINPVVIIFVGYCFGALSPRLREALRLLVVAGLILALLHLLRFVVNPNLLNISATEVRALAGNGNFVVGRHNWPVAGITGDSPGNRFFNAPDYWRVDDFVLFAHIGAGKPGVLACAEGIDDRGTLRQARCDGDYCNRPPRYSGK
jgi:hypothetical protein